MSTYTYYEEAFGILYAVTCLDDYVEDDEPVEVLDTLLQLDETPF